jgi:hypothetical protein
MGRRIRTSAKANTVIRKFSTPGLVAGLLRAHPMSDESPPSSEISGSAPAEGAPRVRRISHRLSKKSAKSATAAKPESPETPEGQTEATIPVVMESVPSPAEAPDESPQDNDWPDPEPASTGGQAGGGEGSKRKRRRKKGKGGSQQQSFPQGPENESSGESAEAPRPPQQHAPRVKVDPELLAKFAWKIYLAEVSEEGVALIGDNDAKDLSRRCFRLAEIFLEEQSRRR